VGSALVAAANRRFADERGGTLALRIDDTDRARNVERGEEAILDDLRWLGIGFDEGPVRQSERGPIHRRAAEQLLRAGRAREEEGTVRFSDGPGTTLVRPDGTATYHLASAVDDVELAITHVIRGKDHLANAPLHAAIARALGARPPEYRHVGLLLGEDGRKLSKRAHGMASLADLREAGTPPEAVRAYLDELGEPQGDVRLDLARLRRLSTDALAALPDEELAGRLGVPPAVVPAVRGAHDLLEAREYAEAIVTRPGAVPAADERTLACFRDLRARENGTLDDEAARSLVRAVRAAGGDLRTLRLALTGRERGPELWTVVRALPLDEALDRIDAVLSP
jgi:hypothetical protein